MFAMNATELLLAVPATYKSAVIALMIAEANVIVDKLNLPEERPITGTNADHGFCVSSDCESPRRHAWHD